MASPIVIKGSRPGRNRRRRKAAGFAALQMTDMKSMNKLKFTLKCASMCSARQF